MKPVLFKKTKPSDFGHASPSVDCYMQSRLHIGEAFWEPTLALVKDHKCADCIKRMLFEYFGLPEYSAEVIYDSVYGANSFACDFPEDEKRHMREAYEEGKNFGLQIKGVVPGTIELVEILNSYEGPYPEDWKAGISDVLRVEVK